MRTTEALLALLVIAVPHLAIADALPGRNVNVRIEGRREPGVALPHDGRGWRLHLRSAATAVVFVDTDINHDKWVLDVARGAVTLQADRFTAGHAYRVEVRRGLATVDRGIVYLTPPRAAKRTRVEFTNDRLSTPDDGLRLIPKTEL